MRVVYMRAMRREYNDMNKLRQCTLSNDPSTKSTCGDYWGGNIGAGTNASAVAVRDGFMYSRCVSDLPSLRQFYEFNVAPLATVSTDNASTTLSTAVLIAPNFNAMTTTTSYISNMTSAPYVTLSFDQVYSIADIAVAFGTKTQLIPSYFEMLLLDNIGTIVAKRLGSALDVVISTNPFYNGVYWWSFATPLKASQFTFSCSSNQMIELRNISVWAVDLNQGTANCACFMNTADAALLGYLPVCDSAACKQLDIMTTSARVQMNDGKTCNKTVFNCSQILNISPTSQATIMQNVTLAQQCGPAARPVSIVTPPPPPPPPPDYTSEYAIFGLLVALCVIYFVMRSKKDTVVKPASTTATTTTTAISITTNQATAAPNSKDAAKAAVVAPKGVAPKGVASKVVASNVVAISEKTVVEIKNPVDTPENKPNMQSDAGVDAADAQGDESVDKTNSIDDKTEAAADAQGADKTNAAVEEVAGEAEAGEKGDGEGEKGDGAA